MVGRTGGGGRRPAPRRRAILLGASNLILGVSVVVETARQAWGAPLDVLAALGHGRSYGLESRFLGRTLPPIVSCGLWDDLAGRTPAPTAALVTDIGNDIVYGAPVSRIAEWVEACLERLTPVCERVTVTELPLESLMKLGRRRFLMLRSVLFPQCPIELDEVLRRADELNGLISHLAVRYEAALVAPSAHWYGWDPIHIRMGRRTAAWKKIFSSWRDGASPRRAAPSLRRWIALSRLKPQRRRWLSTEQYEPQPAARLADGTRISLY